MGLPGAGKTTFTAKLGAGMFFKTAVTILNGDAVREQYNDWDFSLEGRLRQAHRMRELADSEISDGRFAVCDFIAPTEEIRRIFAADYTIWMDTIAEGRFEDTNKIFESPTEYNLRITDFNYNVDEILESLL